MQEIEFCSPRTLREAISILSRADGVGKPLAGGTDLINQMRDGILEPSVIVDVKEIPELNRLEFRPRSGLHIGAAVPCTTIAANPYVKEIYPSLAQACALMGPVQIQNRASIGGNICNAAPSADTVPTLICLGAKSVIAGSKGKHEVLLEEFFLGPGRTILAPDELLVEIIIPKPPRNSACAYQRFTLREELEIAVVGVGVFLELTSRNRKCRDVRMALATAAPTPLRAREAEAFLKGRVIDDGTINEASERAVLVANPSSGIRGSADYRRELIKVLTRRTLKACLSNLTAVPK